MKTFYDLPQYFNELTHRVIGAAIEVHRELGPGFLEKTYEDALVIELRERQIDVQQQVSIPIVYKGHEIHRCCLDLLVENQLVVEVKSVEHVIDVHRAQCLSYLRAGDYDLGLVINFNVKSLRDGISRVIDTTL